MTLFTDNPFEKMMILYPEDRSRMEEIKQADPAAVVVNGYYSGYLGEDRNLDELTAGVRRHYENGYILLFGK